MPDLNATFFLVLFIIGLALVFDFINGMNDAANSIATVVSTRVLSPRWAVVWAAFFNFAAIWIFGVKVASTIGRGIVLPEVVTPYLLMAALIGAVIWSYLATHTGMPISISHSLIGGFCGAAVAKAGFQVVMWGSFKKILLFIVLSPLIGGAIAYLMMVAIVLLFYDKPPGPLDTWFRRLQLVSSAAYSLGHGSNDAQKTAGMIFALLLSTGYLPPEASVPFWVLMLSYFTIALGTMAGGWKVISTLGQKLTKLRPVGGFCAETGSALTLFGTALAGIPVSTTHTITGAIVGVGATHRLSAIRWGIAGKVLWAWILTIPLSAILAAVMYTVIRLFGFQ